MKKNIIPRRDHEVYFLPVPQGLKSKLLRHFVVGQMERLHPGFSGETALDIKRLVINKTRWVMATVMETETLTEYRILHKGCVFFTNTSIAVQKKGFTSGGVQAIGDELIGYDSEKKTPVSIPLEPGKTGGPERQPKTVKTVPARSGVFAGRKTPWRVTAVIVCIALLVPIPLFLFPAAKEAQAIAEVPTVAAAELAPVVKYPPSAIEILAGVSADLVGTGGKITRWRYNEAHNNDNPGPLLIVETRGIDVLSVHRLFSQYGYIVLGDIQDVRYIDGEPHLTVYLDTARGGYLTPPAGTFFSQNFSLPIFSDLTSALKRHDISVVSETLPSAENGNALYTMTYTAKGPALVRSMEIITDICDKYPVRVKGMDVSIGGETNVFTVICSLSQSDAPRYTVSALGDEKGKIPAAFGYRETPPPQAPKAVAVQQQAQQTQQVQQPQQAQQAQKPPEVSIVGTIRDDGGQILFYREEGDSKIKIKDTP